MKLWIDDVRPAPEGYVWCKSVNAAKNLIEQMECAYNGTMSTLNCISSEDEEELIYYKNRLDDYTVDVIDIDHDAGNYARYGGDYIKLLDWLEETGRNYPIHIHSMNPVGVANMRAIIKRNGWVEV